VNEYPALTKEEMLVHLDELNQRLEQKGKHGEIILAGGAALTLVFNARDATRDIDAVFAPTDDMREIIKQIANENDNLSDDWLNDAVKGFVTDKMNYNEFMSLSNLTVYNIDAEGLLAMKLTSHRVDSNDMDDSIFLMKTLNIDSESQLTDIVEKYAGRIHQTPTTRFFTMEAFERYKAEKAVLHSEKTNSNFQERLGNAKVEAQKQNAQAKDASRTCKKQSSDLS